MKRRWIVALAAAAIALACVSATAPPLGWTTTCKIVDVHDGDTITVEVTRRLHVRLLDCWAPEVRGSEKPQGIVSRDALRSIAMGKNATLHIPGDPHGEAWRAWSFGRVLGNVWLDGDAQSLSEHQVAGGYATASKE